MAEKIKILDIRDFPSTDPRRIGRMDRLITYQIDPYHTYVITIPKDEFTETKLKETIKKDAEERLVWLGKEIEI